MFDIAIIGAGINGALIGRELSKYNVSVVVLEKETDIAMGTTAANSGIVHAGFDPKPGTLKARFNVEGCRRMPDLVKELGVSYRQNGTLVVAFTPEEMETVNGLYARGIINGVEKMEILDSEGLHKLEPNISPHAIGALYAPTAGIVCPYGLTFAAMGNAMDNGVVLKTDFKVEAIERKGVFYEIHSSEETVEAGYVINAAGLFADSIAAMVGDTEIKISPRRGEYLLLDKEAADTVSNTIFCAPNAMGKGILVSPTADGNIIVGPTAEDIDSKEDTSTTLKGLQAVVGGSRRSVPAVPLSMVITSFTGVRALGNTGDFIVMPSKNAPCFFHVAGMESPGLASAPAVAAYVEKYLHEIGVLQQKKKTYSPYRCYTPHLKELSDEERAAWIEKDARYGKIVCRCEEISEGEILDAIHMHPKATTIDGIKRRTRGGMGRCQGGFCLPLVTDILSRELKIPMEEVTKRGRGSNILTEKTK